MAAAVAVGALTDVLTGKENATRRSPSTAALGDALHHYSMRMAGLLYRSAVYHGIAAGKGEIFYDVAGPIVAPSPDEVLIESGRWCDALELAEHSDEVRAVRRALASSVEHPARCAADLIETARQLAPHHPGIGFWAVEFRRQLTNRDDLPGFLGLIKGKPPSFERGCAMEAAAKALVRKGRYPAAREAIEQAWLDCGPLAVSNNGLACAVLVGDLRGVRRFSAALLEIWDSLSEDARAQHLGHDPVWSLARDRIRSDERVRNATPQEITELMG